MEYTALLRYFTADEIAKYLRPTCQWDIDLYLRAAQGTTQKERDRFIRDMQRLPTIARRIAAAHNN